MKRVYIDGQAGTTGLLIERMLARVSDIKLESLAAAGARKDAAAKREILPTVDLVILCLPDDAARESVKLIEALPGRRPKILDASTAHRVASGWVFGLPELGLEQERAISIAERVSNPGCYPTGAILLLKPLVEAGLIPADYPICVHAVSGYSGGGRKMIEQFEKGAGSAFELYGLELNHKHVPELQRYARLSRPPIFVPAVAAYRQGMIDSIPFHLGTLPTSVTANDIQSCLARCYRSSKYVRVIEADHGSRLTPDALNGTNYVELRVHRNDSLAQVVLTARYDNLGKGASGAAVQNAGLMLGIDVSAALTFKDNAPDGQTSAAELP
jgi:N-acetyl-gamma-glutamyl-phosphate reductase